MSGCSFPWSNSNFQPQTSQQTPKADETTKDKNTLLQEALDKFYYSTSYHEHIKIEFSDPSMLSSSWRTSEYDGLTIKSINTLADKELEVEKDESGKAQTIKLVKYNESQFKDYTNDRKQTLNTYYKNDGFKYFDSDGKKYKIKDTSGPNEETVSYLKDLHSNKNIELLDLFNQGSQKTVNFSIKPNSVKTSFGNIINPENSNISVTSYTGTITTDENNNVIEFRYTIKYKDNATNATAKVFRVINNINNTTVNLPGDLESYKEALY